MESEATSMSPVFSVLADLMFSSHQAFLVHGTHVEQELANIIQQSESDDDDSGQYEEDCYHQPDVNRKSLAAATAMESDRMQEDSTLDLGVFDLDL